MRWICALALLVLAVSALSDEGSLEIHGVTITKGMTQKDVRALIPESSIYEVPNESDISDGTEFWSIAADEAKGGGSIRFENGQVVSATRNLRHSSNSEAYELFVSLHETIQHLTEGADYTCAKVMTYVPQEIFPQSITVFVLPDRIIEILTAQRGGDRVTIRESLRMNPVPTEEKVHADIGDSGHCVFRG